MTTPSRPRVFSVLSLLESPWRAVSRATSNRAACVPEYWSASPPWDCPPRSRSRTSSPSSAHRRSACPFKTALAWAKLTLSDLSQPRQAWFSQDVAQASGLAAEVHILGLNRPGRSPRCGLVGPVQIRVRDDLVRRRCSPCRLVLRRVGVPDKGRAVSPCDGAVERRADARVGLCADAQPSSNPRTP